MPARLIGRHIVTDPEVCHGSPTFRSTRVLVSDVLEQIAEGLAWETVIEEWHGSISREAIAEALQLATPRAPRSRRRLRLRSPRSGSRR